MKLKRKLFVIALALMVVVPGCKKYEEGPLIDLYSKPKRVQGKWYFDKVTINGEDSSSRYRNGMVEFGLYEKDWGGFVWTFNAYTQQFSETNFKGGVWRFLADKDSFQMKFIDPATQDSTFFRWKIKRLAYNEFWLERTDQDVTTYWELWKFVY